MRLYRQPRRLPRHPCPQQNRHNPATDSARFTPKDLSFGRSGSLLFHHFARLRATHQPDDFAAADLNMSLDKNIADKFRRWNASGSIRAASGLNCNPYFPLSNRIENANIEFTTNEVKLEKTVLKAGESSLELNGKISNLKQFCSATGN